MAQTGSHSDDRGARALEWIRALCHEPDRFAGGEGERRAAERLQDWMRGLGLADVRLQPVPARPRSGFSLALHAGVGLVGAFAGGLAGALLAGLAAWSLPREGARGAPLLSRLLRAGTSVNAVGRRGPETPGRRVVLSAHIDTAQAGAAFDPRLADLFARRSQERAREGAPPAGPLALPGALLWAAVAVAAVGWLGGGGALFGLARALVVLGLGLTVAVGLQWALSRPTPGANDNASAVAAMLLCAEQLLPVLPDARRYRRHFDAVRTFCLFIGYPRSGHSLVGSLLDAHPDWSRDDTCFVNFECVGGGQLHYVVSEGTHTKSLYPPRLIELARRLGEGGGFGAIAPVQLLAGTDGHVPAGRGYPALSLISLEANGVPRNYHRPEDLPEALDADLVVRAADFGAAVVRATLGGEAAPIHRA